MIASTHLTAGAAVGLLSYRFIFRPYSVGGLIGALILGIVSHLLLDMIPHSEDEIYQPDGTDKYQMAVLSAELTLSFLAIYLCGAYGSFLIVPPKYILAGMIGGALPDVPHVLMNALKINWSFLQAVDRVNVFFHTSLHPASFWQGLWPQVTIIAISLTILCFLKLEMMKITP